jgi:glycosyltransferase involved in cell wall biosynthesis
VRRYAEALASSGFVVDCFVLKEKNQTSQKDNGINLQYLNIEQYRGSSNMAYILSYLSFFLRTFFHVSIKNLFRYKIIHVHNMPDFLVFTTIFNKIFGAKVILDIHDTMPEIYKAKFQPPLSYIFYYILLFQEKLSCWYANLVINVHQPHLEHNVKYHGLNVKKAHIISNYADTNLFNLHQYQHIDSNNIYGKGDGVNDLKQTIDQYNLSDHVKYHGQIPLSDIPEKLYNSDIGIVSYHISEATNLMLPLKLMENIAMGLPTMTVRNKAIDYYFEDDELIYYIAGDADSFCDQLLDLVQSPNSLKTFAIKASQINNRLNWEDEKVKYLNIIESIIKDRPMNNYKTITNMKKS